MAIHHQFTTDISGSQRIVSLGSRIQTASSSVLLLTCVCTGWIVCHDAWDGPILNHTGRCRPSAGRGWPDKLYAKLSRGHSTWTIWLRGSHGTWIWIRISHTANYCPKTCVSAWILDDIESKLTMVKWLPWRPSHRIRVLRGMIGLAICIAVRNEHYATASPWFYYRSRSPAFCNRHNPSLIWKLQQRRLSVEYWQRDMTSKYASWRTSAPQCFSYRCWRGRGNQQSRVDTIWGIAYIVRSLWEE